MIKLINDIKFCTNNTIDEKSFRCLIQRDSESQISEKDTLDALEIQVISLNFLDKTLCTI